VQPGGAQPIGRFIHRGQQRGAIALRLQDDAPLRRISRERRKQLERGSHVQGKARRRHVFAADETDELVIAAAGDDAAPAC
jgi:hypothetical protein